MKENKKFYIAPMVEMMNVRVEKGFEATGETELLKPKETMRKTFVLIAAALMAFGAVSCKKEIENNDLSNRPVRFSATMENSGDSKTTLNGYALLWADGDQVKVMCDEFTSAGVYQVVSGGKRHADFVFAGEESSEETLVAPFKAGYPADYWNDNVTSITLPATQNYVANGMEQFPMYGGVRGRKMK